MSGVTLYRTSDGRIIGPMYCNDPLDLVLNIGEGEAVIDGEYDGREYRVVSGEAVQRHDFAALPTTIEVGQTVPLPAPAWVRTEFSGPAYITDGQVGADEPCTLTILIKDADAWPYRRLLHTIEVVEP